MPSNPKTVKGKALRGKAEEDSDCDDGEALEVKGPSNSVGVKV